MHNEPRLAISRPFCPCRRTDRHSLPVASTAGRRARVCPASAAPLPDLGVDQLARASTNCPHRCGECPKYIASVKQERLQERRCWGLHALTLLHPSSIRLLVSHLLSLAGNTARETESPTGPWSPLTFWPRGSELFWIAWAPVWCRGFWLLSFMAVAHSALSPL